MSTEAQTILKGLRQAVDIMEGSAPETEYVKHRFDPVQAPETIDVRSIRQRMGLSQAVFASAFGLSLYTLRNWEQGKRQPDPAARAYLRVIEVAGVVSVTTYFLALFLVILGFGMKMRLRSGIKGCRQLGRMGSLIYVPIFYYLE